MARGRRQRTIPAVTEIVRLEPSQRGQLARLLDDRSAGDAMAAYYALRHPAERLELHAYTPTPAGATGFLAVAQTGLDLFRPLAVPFVASARGLTALLRAGLRPSRPVLLHLPLDQQAWLGQAVTLSEARPAELLRLDMRSFRPMVNVLVVETQSPGGWPRYEIRSGKALYGAAGLNWKGTTFAEIYLEVAPEARQTGYGRSVLAAIAGRMLSESVIALLRVEDQDLDTRADALALGFRPTGIRTLTAQAVLHEQTAAAPAPPGRTA